MLARVSSIGSLIYPDRLDRLVRGMFPAETSLQPRVRLEEEEEEEIHLHCERTNEFSSLMSLHRSG